jgi:hypothetical protein
VGVAHARLEQRVAGSPRCASVVKPILGFGVRRSTRRHADTALHLVADFGVSSVERYAALCLCGEKCLCALTNAGFVHEFL